MREIWKPIKGYEGLYSVSNMGRVKSLAGKQRGSGKGTPIYQSEDIDVKPCMLRTGYLGFNLCQDGEKKHALLHRIVATAFVPNPDNLPQVNHKDGNKRNNRADNLEWVTAKQNVRHAFDTGIHLPTIHKEQCKVLQVTDREGNTQTFPSMAEAARHLGVTRQSITNCIRRGVSNRKGYKFQLI